MASSKNCTQCSQYFDSLNHPCLNHAGCSAGGLWNPEICQICTDLFEAADISESPCEAKSNLISLSRQILLSSNLIGPKSSIFWSEAVLSKFSRPWLKDSTFRKSFDYESLPLVESEEVVSHSPNRKLLDEAFQKCLGVASQLCPQQTDEFLKEVAFSSEKGPYISSSADSGFFH